MKTFITELNHEQVDVMGDNFPDHVIYFNAKIHWGLELVENQRSLSTIPFVERIQIFSGYDARNSNKMLIVKDNFEDIVDNIGDWDIEESFSLDNNRDSFDIVTIIPNHITVNVSKKEVEVLFNA